MQEYDVALKSLLRGTAKFFHQEVAGTPVGAWLDVELPEVQNLRLDLLGETANGELVHIEVQSSNDPTMPLRMAEYCLKIYRRFGRFPRQVLLYVGEAPLRMESKLSGPNVLFRYRTLDIRDVDGEHLMESPDFGDNVIAILARLRDRKDAVRRIVEKIASLDSPDRETALSSLVILAGLRNLEETVEEEVGKVPILNSILDHKVLGREYKKGLAEGKREGEIEGELKILRRLIEKRFGSVSRSVEERLAARSTAELEKLTERVLDARSIEELFEQ